MASANPRIKQGIAAAKRAVATDNEGDLPMALACYLEAAQALVDGIGHDRDSKYTNYINQYVSRAEAIEVELAKRDSSAAASSHNRAAAAAAEAVLMEKTINRVSVDYDELCSHDQVSAGPLVNVQAESYDAPPLSWTPQLHDVQIFDVEDEGERAEVCRTFYASLDRTRHGTFNVTKLQRIQNRPLWKEYGNEGVLH